MLLKLALAGGLAAIVGLHFWQDHRTAVKLEQARETISNHEQTIENYEDTNNKNLANIDELEAANDAWAAKWEEHAGDWDAERARLTAQLAAERDARARDRAAATAELERILNEDIDAATWGAQPVPGSIAGWVCDQLAGACTGGAEGNQGPGADGA